MSSSDSYLLIQNLTKRFGEFEALSQVSLEVNQSELICLLGPSGCGKTTVLRCIAGLETPTVGTIVQNGVDITSLPPEDRDFGIVFQSYALFPNLTVNENLGFGLVNRKLSKQKIQERVEQLIATVGLEGHSDKYPGQLSGGQQQRVALARALATSPGLLLLDEPLSALDAKVRQRLRREILDLQRRIGITTVLVTHDQEEALTMGDRIVVMDHGVIAQTGTPQEIYSNPTTPFVANFIGKMNFLDGIASNTGEVAINHFSFNCAKATETFSSGDRVLLCIRPEDIVIYDSEFDNNEVNCNNAFVIDSEFLGSVFRIRLAFEESSSTEFIAEVPPSDMRSLEIKNGTNVTIKFPPERLHVYPA